MKITPFTFACTCARKKKTTIRKLLLGWQQLEWCHLNQWYLIAQGEPPYPWKCKGYTEHKPVILLQRTEHCTGKSRHLSLNPNFITSLANYFTSSCFSQSICWKGITILNCFPQCFENWEIQEPDFVKLLFRAFCFFRFTLSVWARLAACPVSMG